MSPGSESARRTTNYKSQDDRDTLQFTRPAAGTGSAISVLFRPFPLSPILMRWNARIVEFEWDHRFCDEQAHGPFAYWRHCHTVSEEAQDEIEGTRIVDDLVYELPLGIFSEPAWRNYCRDRSRAYFNYS